MSRPYKDGEVLAIEYTVYINGLKLDTSKKECINSISIKETVDGADTATLKISDPKFLYIEDNIFVEESKIKITLGWVGVSYRVKFEGYISAIDIDFQSNGVPLLTITCMDNTHLMNREKKKKTYKNKTSAEVVQEIVKAYGYQFVTEAEKDYKFEKQETITQSKQTDIDFITKLAKDEVHPFTARLIGNTFYYVKKGHLASPKMTLTYLKYPHEIISFNPKINKETLKSKVSSAKVGSKNKKLSTTALTNNATSSSKTSGGNGGNNSSSEKAGNHATKTYDPRTRRWR